MTWYPIQTAPKDGTDVLLWWPNCGTPVVGGWYRNRWALNADHYSVSCMAYCYGGCVGNDPIIPTLWMPVPVPSEAERA